MRGSLHWLHCGRWIGGWALEGYAGGIVSIGRWLVSEVILACEHHRAIDGGVFLGYLFLGRGTTWCLNVRGCIVVFRPCRMRGNLGYGNVAADERGGDERGEERGGETVGGGVGGVGGPVASHRPQWRLPSPGFRSISGGVGGGGVEGGSRAVWKLAWGEALPKQRSPGRNRLVL